MTDTQVAACLICGEPARDGSLCISHGGTGDCEPVPGARILLGDCVERMRELEDASIDAVVTDPPYGLRFMGKTWDYELGPAGWCSEALRVLKPGGHLLAFGGTRTYHRLVCRIEDVGFEIRDSLHWIYGSGMPKSPHVLKPAHEPIVLARKPLVTTVAQNVERFGTGVLHVNGCRVPAPAGDREDYGLRGNPVGGLTGVVYGGWEVHRDDYRRPPEGRRPPNVLLGCPCASAEHNGDCPAGEMGLQGNAARFFPVFRYVAKPSRKERGPGNKHPTVKPIALMRWLCRLVTPPGGIILDPFLGSGSTALATVAEGFHIVGIDQSAEHVETSARRLRAKVTT